jgi:hypothetical protein
LLQQQQILSSKPIISEWKDMKLDEKMLHASIDRHIMYFQLTTTYRSIQIFSQMLKFLKKIEKKKFDKIFWNKKKKPINYYLL